MYQAPPPTNQALFRQADRYALAIGALAGLIVGLLYSFDSRAGDILLAILAKIIPALLLFIPYALLDDLAGVDWLARVRRLIWIYGGLAGLALLLRLISSQPFRWLAGSIASPGSILISAGISLLLERRHVRPKL
jgi:hypothetical protein